MHYFHSLGKTLFWNNFTEEESEEYLKLQKIVTLWCGWSSLKKKIQEVTPQPYQPTDNDLMRYEILAMKGWDMI